MGQHQEFINNNTENQPLPIALNIFWLGFIIYTASYVISSTNEVNYVVCNVFQILGLVLLLPSAVILIKLEIKNIYLKVVYIVYCLWLLIIVLRGFEFNYEFYKQLLFDPNSGIFLYLVPLILLIPVTPAFLKKMTVLIVVLGIIYLIYDLIFIKKLLYPHEDIQSQAIVEYFTQYLSLASGFILLTFLYHSRKINLFALFIMCLTFIIAVIRARRGLILMSFSMLFFAYFIYQKVNKTEVVRIVISLFFVSILAYASVRIYSENRKDTFSLITERIGQQTRLAVEQYFYRDMKTKDWLIGKGFNGEYFCPGVTEGVGRISIYRNVIETGYLQVILNGGLVSLLLLLLIIIPAIIKGLFYSNNILSKAAGIWIFLFLLYMYPGTINKFSMHYILIWISVGICYSKQIRNLSDEKIKDLLIAKTKMGSLPKQIENTF